MFERYTERARRVLFFARYEASEFGSLTIEADHLLLGLLRDIKGLIGGIFDRAGISLASVRDEMRQRARRREKVSTSVEIPFAADAKKILEYTAEEADRLGHGYIGTEHLLLGILREGTSTAAKLLTDRGLALDSVRQEIVDCLREPPRAVGAGISPVDHIKRLVDELARTGASTIEGQDTLDRIHAALDALKSLLGDQGGATE